MCQRVTNARVLIDGTVRSEIGAGLCALVGVAREDRADEVERMARRVALLRVFENDEGRFSRSVIETGGAVLAVSQFTLIADTRKGNRPSFAAAAAPDEAEPLYEHFCRALEQQGVQVARGVFGARMQLELVNDGPVTIVVD